MFTTCLPRVYHVSTTCSPRVYHVFNFGSLRVHHVFTTCSPLLRRPPGPQVGILRCHVMNSRALLRKTKRCPRLLMHSRCIPRGALLVHSWCTPGALLVHSWCTSGALLVYSWCTPGALPVHFRCILVHSRCTPKVSRKGIASLPKGSLDSPFRNVWIAFSLTYKPERELHRFRKEASILRTETFGSPFCQFANTEREMHRFRKEVSILRTETFGSPFRQLANPKGKCTASERKPRSSAQKRLDRLFANLQTRKGNCTASERKPRSSAQKRLDRPRHYHIHHRKRRNHDQAAAECPSNAPNREVDERAWGPSGTKSCWDLSLREYSDVHTQNCTCGTRSNCTTGTPTTCTATGRTTRKSRKVWTMGKTSAPRRGSQRP